MGTLFSFLCDVYCYSTAPEEMAAIAAMWRDLVENYSERTLWVAGAALHTVTFVAFNVGLYFMHRYQILARYKIQPLKYPTDELIRKGLKDVSIKHALAPFVLYLVASGGAMRSARN